MQGQDINKELEIKLIRRAQENPNNFGPLYEKYFEQIFRFIYQRLSSKDEAADITSMVFLKALLNIKKYKDRGFPFSSWLYRIALNELNSMFRKNKVRKTINTTTEQLNFLLNQFSDKTAENELEERKQKLIILIKQLSLQDSNLIEMRFFEGMSFKEMGVILNITENNAKVKTYRLIDKLRKQMI